MYKRKANDSQVSQAARDNTTAQLENKRASYQTHLQLQNTMGNSARVTAQLATQAFMANSTKARQNNPDQSKKLNNTGLPDHALQTAPAQLSSDPLATHSPTQAVVQRDVYPHHEKPTAKVDAQKILSAKKIAQHISDIVDRVRPVAVDWRQFSGEQGYLKNWHAQADTYYKSGGTTDAKFLHTSFGYAIETLACRQLSNAMEGLNIALQVSTGHTRPDVEITDNGDNIVSWMDITTNAEKDHTGKKSGGGWSTHPYVCEILYDSLTPDEVFTASNHPFYSQEGQLLANKAQHRSEAYDTVKLDMLNFFDSQRVDNPQFMGPGGNQSTKKKAIKEFAREEFGEDFGGNQIDKTMTGTLLHLGLNPGHFGYKKGKQSIYGFNQYVTDTAQPDIDKRNQQLFNQHHSSVGESLHRYQYSPQMEGFQSSWQQLEQQKNEQMQRQKEEQLRKDFMRKACILEAEKLKAAYLKLGNMTEVPNYKFMANKMASHLFKMPIDGEIAKGNSWLQECSALLEWFNEIVKHFTVPVLNNQYFGGPPGSGNPSGESMDF